MTKPGGLVVITCASKGRLEHGTRRARFDASPGTNSVGIDYYRNLNQVDFERAVNLGKMFSAYKFFYVRKSFDLYFVGWKTGNSVFTGDIKAFSRAVDRIRTMNKGKVRVKLFDIPINIARRLNMEDKSFQNFAFKYLSTVRPVRHFLKSLSRPRGASR